MSHSVKEILIEGEQQKTRLDIFLARQFADSLSRSQIKKMIDLGAIRVSGREVPAHYRLKGGDKIEMEWPEPSDEGTRAENIPIEIIYEDADIILVNKPAGMVVHPACGNPHHTLVNALLYHIKHLSARGGAVRPGLVHRLDKDTSGIMVVAKNDYAHAFLAKQFKNQTMERSYRVVVKGIVQHEEGMCEEAVGRAFLNRKKMVIRPSGGKEAATYYRVIRRFSRTTLLEVRPITGRTHQIRVHMAHIDHPVMGDAFYGITTPGIGRQAVHAFGLGLVHPQSKEKMYFECPMPRDMLDLLSFLESRDKEWL